MQKEFPSHIFKSYDIRGLVGSELNEELAYFIGRSYAIFLKRSEIELDNKYVVVGSDMRESSTSYEAQVIRGITDEGLDVMKIGLTSTPLFNFATVHFDDHAAGVMVTASHNPSEYNGFKFTLGSGVRVGGGSGMEMIRDLAKAGNFDESEVKGEVGQREVIDDYIDKLFSLVPRDSIKPLSIVVDSGNGMGGVVLPKVLEQIPQVSVEYLYIEPDGNFPNHEANPLKIETLVDLQTKVKELEADIGFAMDGDADRIGLVDEKGDIVDASFVGLLAGLEILKKKETGNMFYDLRSSMIVPEVWKDYGGKPEMTTVGHANIMKDMREKSGIFASELSQHLYFGDLYNGESSDLALLIFLQMISREGKTLSELVSPYKKYFHSGEINFEVEEKDKMLQAIEDKYGPASTEISHLDGLWMSFDWGFINVRKSNTEPVLRLNLEAKDEGVMKEKVEELRGILTNGLN